MAAEMERPANVPANYVWVNVSLGAFETDEEADAALAAWEPPARAMGEEFTFERLDDGRARVSAGYWAPPHAEERSNLPWLIGGIAAMGLAVVVIAASGSKDRGKPAGTSGYGDPEVPYLQHRLRAQNRAARAHQCLAAGDVPCARAAFKEADVEMRQMLWHKRRKAL